MVNGSSPPRSTGAIGATGATRAIGAIGAIGATRAIGSIRATARRTRYGYLRRPGLALAFALVFVLASTPRPSAANPPEPASKARAASPPPPRSGGAVPATALQHYRRAIELHDAGAHEAALAHFERAYAISRNHQLLFNIGQLRYGLRRFARARAALERYLEEGGSRISLERQHAVQRQLEELARKTSLLAVHLEGGPVRLEVQGRALAPSAARVGASEFPTRTVIWTAAGALGGLAISGAVATRLSSNHYDELRSSPAESSARAHRQRLDRQRDRIEALALATDVLAVAALSAAGLGVFIALSEPDERPPLLALRPGQVELSVEF